MEYPDYDSNLFKVFEQENIEDENKLKEILKYLQKVLDI